jgi:hypothetical protein
MKAQEWPDAAQPGADIQDLVRLVGFVLDSVDENEATAQAAVNAIASILEIAKQIGRLEVLEELRSGPTAQRTNQVPPVYDRGERS